MFGESFFIFLALLALVSLVLGPVAFFRIGGLRRRIETLEGRLRATELNLAALRTAAPPAAEITTAPPPVADIAAENPLPEPSPEPDGAAEPSAAPTLPEMIAAKQAEAGTQDRDQPQGKSLEERLGARWAVIVGGLALAIGLLLLVRYSLEKGIFGPATRVSMGLAVSTLLLLAGEWLRRRESALGARLGPALPGAIPIPAVLTAAGTAGAFGAVYAAHALYSLIGPALAFVALGLVGIGAMLAAALHGPALAGLGLAGSLLSPVLVSSSNPNPWPVLVYVAIVAGAAYWLARLRHWLWLALATAGGAAVWALLLSEGIGKPARPAEFFAASALHILLHLALALIVFAWPYRGNATAQLSRSATAVGAAFAAVGSIVLQDGTAFGQFGVLWMVLAAGIPLMLAATGTQVGAASLLVPVAGLSAAGITRVWPHRSTLPSPGYTVESFFTAWVEPESLLALVLLAGGVGLAVLALAADRLRRAPALPSLPAHVLAASAFATPVLVLGLIWMRLPARPVPYALAAVAGALAVLFVLLAATFRRLAAGQPDESARLGLGFFATGALAALALGATIALEGGHLTLALAFTALAAAWISVREDIPALRWCVAVIGAIIAARMFWDPRIVGAQLSATPVFNWLLVGYGGPALAFGLAARLLRREPEDLPVQAAQAFAILFSALLCFFEIRHALNNGNAFSSTVALLETGLQVSMGLIFAFATTWLSGPRRNGIFSWASLLFGFGTMAVAVFGLGIVVNPFLDWFAVPGGRVFNGLMLAYAIPAILAAMLARFSIGRRPEVYRRGAALTAIFLGFLYVNLQTRRFFHEALISSHVGFTDGEVYSYSAVWLVLGLALLLYGIVMRSREARFGSALLVVAATVKVFIFDVAGLDGALRAVSFMGLGLVLIGIGYLYQKLLFRPKPAVDRSEGT